MNLNRRLRDLERRHGGIVWCRCPYDRERERAETLRAYETGEPTPGVCDRCGGTRISIQYVATEAYDPDVVNVALHLDRDLPNEERHVD